MIEGMGAGELLEEQLLYLQVPKAFYRGQYGRLSLLKSGTLRGKRQVDSSSLCIHKEEESIHNCGNGVKGGSFRSGMSGCWRIHKTD